MLIAHFFIKKDFTTFKSMKKEKFIPTEEQIKKGKEMLTEVGAVFESPETFPHNRSDDYLDALKSIGYPNQLTSIGTQVPEIGYMFAVIDSSQIEITEARQLIVNHFQ